MSESDLVESSDPSGLNLRPKRRVTQLNRRAQVLLIAAGMLVFIAMAYGFSNPTQVAAPRTAQAATSVNADRHWEKEGDGVAPRPVSAPPPSEDAVVPVSIVPTPTEYIVPEEEKQRIERHDRAVRSGGTVAAFATLAGAPPAFPPSGAIARPGNSPDLTPLEALAGSLETKDDTILQNNQSAKRLFVEGQNMDVEDETNPNVLRQPSSPYEVNAGMIIPAVLITKGDSDLPGLMTARVRENVYDDATGRHLLIPQGTRLVGVYDSVVTFGQRRLLVAWQRMILPDASKLNIGSMPGVDLAGAAGFQDKVNRHYHRTFGGAFLLSALTAGITLSQDDSTGGGIGNERSTSQRVQDTLATALGQNLGEVANEIIRREMNVQPTIEIRPGYRFNIFVQKDLIFEGPYPKTYAGGLVP